MAAQPEAAAGHVTLVPVLQAMRELYSQPPGTERFKEYLRMATSMGDMALPISRINPMAKAHALTYVEKMIALDAENVAIGAAAAASAELPADALQLSLILLDDLKGGWTNRTFAEFEHRYERKYEVQRGWAVVVLWTSEEPSREFVRERTREAMYRTIAERDRGPVRTLREIMKREGETMRFAGRTSSRYDAATLASIEVTIAPHLDSNAAPVVIASLYGDEIAASLGYPPLGLPAHAAYEAALARELNGARRTSWI
ncbi:MAG: hypothetical protein ABI282_07990 [Candidatus Baltobacteraceae bacterium]